MLGHLFDLSPWSPWQGRSTPGRGMVTKAARDGHRVTKVASSHRRRRRWSRRDQLDPRDDTGADCRAGDMHRLRAEGWPAAVQDIGTSVRLTGRPSDFAIAGSERPMSLGRLSLWAGSSASRSPIRVGREKGAAVARSAHEDPTETFGRPCAPTTIAACPGRWIRRA